MSNDETRILRRKRQVEPTESAPEASGPSPLLEQAQARMIVARETHEDCVKGAEAEKELHQRRNTSAQ